MLTIDHQGMTRIVSPLESDDKVRLGCEKVNHLAFAFISPLCPNDHYIGHCCTPNLCLENCLICRPMMRIILWDLQGAHGISEYWNDGIVVSKSDRYC